MTDKRDVEGNLLPNSNRVIKFGRALRKSRLNVIRRALNLINNTVSVVESRPLLVHCLLRYNVIQHHCHDVRPSIASLVQVSIKDLVALKDRFEYFLQYTKKITLINDLKIIAKIIKNTAVIKERISSETSLTIKKFVA